MTYNVETTAAFDKEFKKLDRPVQKILKAWIEKNLIDCVNPRQHGKALKGNLQEFWRYRVGDYRILAAIQDDRLIILAMSVGHRKNIYEKF
jgi:mRNA interferase RelE/StbE